MNNNKTKAEVNRFNNSIIKLCKAYNVPIISENEDSICLSAVNKGVKVFVRLEKFDNKYRSSLLTLQCQLSPEDITNQDAHSEANRILKLLKGDCFNFKYNCYPDNIEQGIEHLDVLLGFWDNISIK